MYRAGGRVDSSKQQNQFILLIGQSNGQASHPPHLRNDVLSSFIPFCAFKSDLTMSKPSPVWLPGISFPLCSSFLPTILEGQLCYKIQVNATADQGKANELMMLLDYNEDLSLTLPVRDEEISDLPNILTSMNFDPAGDYQDQ